MCPRRSASASWSSRIGCAAARTSPRASRRWPSAACPISTGIEPRAGGAQGFGGSRGGAMSEEAQHPRAAAAVEGQALAHVWIHSARWLDLAERDGLKVMVRGEGCRLFDARGRSYLDGLSGLYVVNIGHGRAEIGEAMARQARELAYVSAASYTNLAAVELADVLAGLTPGDLDRFFFCSGGSEAVESALKIAKQVQAMRGFPKRYKVIARRGGYHGATFAAMSITASRNEQYFGPFMYGVSFVPSPNRYRNDFGIAGEEGDLRCAEAIEQEILAQGPETVAAVIGEPVSVSNGNHVPSPRYWQRVREICDRHGVLLIMDEVINGFGRTGTMFATVQFGVVPDLMTMAKELSRRSAEQGRYLLGLLEGLRAHPTVGDVRGLGLMCAVELVKDKGTKEPFGVGPAAANHPYCRRLSALMEERGLLTRVFSALQLCPPLVVSREEIDQMVAIVDESLTLAEREFGFA